MGASGQDFRREDRVIVVGAGPVGLVLALRLARAGVSVLVLEAEVQPVEELRASTFHPPTLDMLEEFGITAKLIEQGLITPTWQVRMHPGGERAEFDLSVLKGHTAHPYRLQCEQWKLMRFLEEELRKLPGSDIRFGHEVTSVRQDDVAGGLDRRRRPAGRLDRRRAQR